MNQSESLYRMSDAQTRWISPENPTGAKGQGGKSNHGAKGDAFIVLAPGETKTIADVKGCGIIHRMWMSGTIPRSPEQRRLIRIEMYWDGATHPAVNCPIGDFFGAGLGLVAPFENALFSNPESKSFNFTIPIPFRKQAQIKLVNESPYFALIWFDINYSAMKSIPEDSLYFHAAWHREPATVQGRDFEILPRISGRGRYLGANIGVVGNPEYQGTWFGEGEVKVFLDGDRDHPTLVGTGTEDYIATGWGQGVFKGRYAGSLISDSEHDLYAFYRFHLDDPVWFHQDCRVTIQQIGNTSVERFQQMVAKGVKIQPLWVLDAKGSDIMKLEVEPSIYRLLDMKDLSPASDPKNSGHGVHFYRSDDVSATVYFYLDKPENTLPSPGSPELRVKGMRERVWSKHPE